MRKFFTFFAVLFIAVAANATTKTIYCKVTADWWNWDYSNQTAVGAYAWNDGDEKNAEWPGVKMTEVWKEDGAWSIELDAKYTHIIFTRILPDGTYKGVKTANLDIPTDDKNMYTITREEFDWSSEALAENDGSWSKFTPIKFFITGSENLVGEGKAWQEDAIKATEDSYTFENLEAGNYTLKVIAPEGWLGYGQLTAASKAVELYPDQDDNICFTLADAGDVKVTYIKDDVFKAEGAFVLPVVTLHGIPSGDSPSVLAPAEDKLSASVTVELAANNAYLFKVICGGTWLGKEDANPPYELKRDWPSVSGLTYSGDDMKLSTDKAGDYTFTWTFATRTLTVTFPDYTLVDGYYLVGNFGDVPAWGVEDLNPTKKFKVNPGDDKEYMLEHVTLIAEDSLKVASVKKDIIEWYAPDAANYVVDADHAGADKTVYFRPAGDGGEGWWYNCIFVEANSGTAIDNTDAAAKATKVVRNGMLLIEKNGHVYNVLGTMVK